jgi:uncharacterized membrane protein
MTLAATLIVCSVLAGCAVRLGALTADGALVTIGFAAAVVIGLGVLWVAVLALLYLLALIVTRISSGPRSRPGSARGRGGLDLAPAGGTVAVCALVVQPESSAIVAVTAVLSFVLADVFASELGPMYSSSAVLPLTHERVPHGTPGAMSLAGLIAGSIGSAAGALAAAIANGEKAGAAVFVGGQTGALVDGLAHARMPLLRRRNVVANLLGATLAVAIALAIWSL